MFTFSLLTSEENGYSFRASLLTFDKHHQILADPSWNGGGDGDCSDVGSHLEKLVKVIEPHLKQLNAIILSHSTSEFISGYILLCVFYPKLMSTIPVYSTLPVNQLGRISTVEYYRSRGILGPLLTSLIELDDIDNWFDKFKIVKYLQNVTLGGSSGDHGDITLTPYNSGHSLGGTFWLIVKRIDRVIYAPSWNHSRDSLLNSANFINSQSGNPHVSLLRPTAFITATDLGSSMSHKKRCDKFLQVVDATLANGGAAIIPTSISGRFLELFHLVDEHLKGAPIPVYFLSYSGTKVLSYASGLLDWMSSNFHRSLNSTMDYTLPFNPNKVDLLLDPQELMSMMGPKIIFCSGEDLRDGDLSSKVFSYLCNDEKTTVILTEKPSSSLSSFSSSSSSSGDGGISNELYNSWATLAKQKTGKITDGVAVPVDEIIQVDKWTLEEELTGKELVDFQNEITAKRKEKLITKVRDQKIQNLLNTDNIDADDSSDEDDEDDEDEEYDDENEKERKKNGKRSGKNGKVGLFPSGKRVGEIFDKQVEKEKRIDGKPPTVEQVDELIQHEAFIMDHIKQSLEKHLPIDIRITHKFKPRQAMFPYFPQTIASRMKFDDYGQIIDVNDFTKKDEVSNSKIIMEGKRKFDEKKQRGKRQQGDGSDGDRGDRKNNNNNNNNNNNKHAAAAAAAGNKLTPQEQVNQQLLHKYLDTLSKPLKRIPVESLPNSRTQLKIRCGLAYVDLSGTVDLRSLGIIIQALKPYNLILLPDSRVTEPTEEGDNSNRGVIQVEKFFQQQQSEQAMEHTKRQLFNSSRYLSLASVRDGLSSAYSRGSGSGKMNVLVAYSDKPIKIGVDSRRSGSGDEDGDDDNAIELNNFEINLDDQLVTNLKWQKIGDDYRVAKVYGELEVTNLPPAESSSSSKRRRKVSDFINSNTQFSLKPINSSASTTKSTTVLDKITNPKLKSMIENATPKLAIGDIRLPDLRKKLISYNTPFQNQPLQVEFKCEGTLVVNGTLAIRKITYLGSGGGGEGDDDNGAGDIVIDGNVGPLYYRVKECIREMLAYV
ncbi:hypothetical protein KGF56_001993 [Candida oxycetoniae]|uniref:Cleavage and polyadenylation specificity factor subunit 2 n=1 Tax=Candida oxycetoniae TaxID=497107 RepID=A0AAI9SYB9_9ASCO|nr:uncharacterized protein KGF56_001993 [Candida oxycetoniae]KAI3405216.2 hypothetical protein KGF56_001993 [Candida oxycetoniae]